MLEDQGTIDPKVTAEAAADWMIRLNAAPEDAELARAFEAWLASAPEHQRAFDAQCRLWNLLGEVKDQPALGARPSRLSSQPHPRRAPDRPHRAPVRRGRIAAFALSGALAAGLALLLLPGLLLQMDADVMTGTGETRSVQLEDGSTVTLGGRSALAFRFDEGHRGVRLITGEAFFEVTPDPSRPFVVDAEQTEVRVLGTAFNVRRDEASSDVALAHGVVEATFRDGVKTRARRMVPGEQLHYQIADGTLTRETVPVEDIGGWRSGRLVVSDMSVGEVVERIRRYHGAWIALPDATLAAERVTGAYDLRHPDEALAALVEPFGGRVHALSPYLRIVARL